MRSMAAVSQPEAVQQFEALVAQVQVEETSWADFANACRGRCCRCQVHLVSLAWSPRPPDRVDVCEPVRCFAGSHTCT